MGLALSVPAWAGIVEVTAVSRSFAEGQKVTAAVLRYDEAISADVLGPEVFSVAGRTVTGVFASNGAGCLDRNRCEVPSSRTIVVELSPG